MPEALTALVSKQIHARVGSSSLKEEAVLVPPLSTGGARLNTTSEFLVGALTYCQKPKRHIITNT